MDYLETQICCTDILTYCQTDKFDYTRFINTLLELSGLESWRVDVKLRYCCKLRDGK